MARRRELDDALELMHFGFRAIIAEPDRELEERGFGRVHHRVLYFVRRNEPLTVGDLIVILGVTKQALHRPLSELVAAKLVVRETEGRFVRLRLSAAGAAFEEKLSGIQREHFETAFHRAGKVGERGWRQVMQALADGTFTTPGRIPTNGVWPNPSPSPSSPPKRRRAPSPRTTPSRSRRA